VRLPWARGSLANSFSNLNLSRRQTALFQEIILVGNQMSRIINLEHPLPVPKDRAKLGRKWCNLMIALANMLWGSRTCRPATLSSQKRHGNFYFTIV